MMREVVASKPKFSDGADRTLSTIVWVLVSTTMKPFQTESTARCRASMAMPVT